MVGWHAQNNVMGVASAGKTLSIKHGSKHQGHVKTTPFEYSGRATQDDEFFVKLGTALTTFTKRLGYLI